MRTLLRVSRHSLLLPAMAAAQAPDRDSAPVTPLAALVAQVEVANPGLSAARRETDAAIARIRPAGAPPIPRSPPAT